MKTVGYLYVSGDKTIGLADYDGLVSGARRVVGLEGTSLYSSKDRAPHAASDQNCVIAVDKTLP